MLKTDALTSYQGSEAGQLNHMYKAKQSVETSEFKLSMKEQTSVMKPPTFVVLHSITNLTCHAVHILLEPVSADCEVATDPH